MTDRSWDTIDREIAYSCEGFDIVTDDVVLPDGQRTEFDYLSEAESVVVLPFTSSGTVVVIEEWRQAVGRVNRGLPAGNVEPDEPVDDAARRELREETGHEAGQVSHMVTVEPANGFSDAVFHYYVARACAPTGRQDLDHDETITVETTTLADLVEAVRDGELRDGRAAFGVLYYALFGSDQFPADEIL